jgi:hypothetical protein
VVPFSNRLFLSIICDVVVHWFVEVKRAEQEVMYVLKLEETEADNRSSDLFPRQPKPSDSMNCELFPKLSWKLVQYRTSSTVAIPFSFFS